MDQRTRFIADYCRRHFSTAELCRRFGISRKTGYKWIERFESEGLAGLHDRSRRPRNCPHATDDGLVQAVLDARRHHPRWGPKKLLWLLERRLPGFTLPSPATVSNILRRHGLSERPRRRHRPGHPGRPDTPMTAPNDIWTADFKGHFRTGDGRYCYPLTVIDGFSRYLLGCQSLPSTEHHGTKAVFQRLFHQFGLPAIIRTDNGVPFATTALGRLSRLSVWWVRLGIYPELIEPASPQQNGRHERFHRTLKRDTARPPAGHAAAQQRRFNSFRREYNDERPHEALGQQTPASLYVASSKPLPARLPDLHYPDHFELRRVSLNAGIRWNSHWVNVSHVLGGEYVGLEEIDDGVWDLYFGPLKLGRMDERDLRIEDSLGRKARRKL